LLDVSALPGVGEGVGAAVGLGVWPGSGAWVVTGLGARVTEPPVITPVGAVGIGAVLLGWGAQ